MGFKVNCWFVFVVMIRCVLEWFRCEMRVCRVDASRF